MRLVLCTMHVLDRRVSNIHTDHVMDGLALVHSTPVAYLEGFPPCAAVGIAHRESWVRESWDNCSVVCPSLWEALGASERLWEPLEYAVRLWEILGDSGRSWETLGASARRPCPVSVPVFPPCLSASYVPVCLNMDNKHMLDSLTDRHLWT